MTRTLGLYLHIPFCKSKCAYCDFASWPGRERDMPAYAKRLQNELHMESSPDFLIDTVYIGGGTPSVLPPSLMARILDALRRDYRLAPDAEFSCECNPGTVTREFLSVLKEYGCNRLSMGAQAAQTPLLRMLGRIHVWEDVIRSAELARETGFNNLNLDLMLGLPGQTEKDVAETLKKALALSPTHLSCYGLIVEEGTPMQRRIASGEWRLPEDETERAEYETCREVLAANGFEQYEISNFALPGFACRHNVHCWQRKEYLGFGCAACGFLGNERWQNPPRLDDYLAGKEPEITQIGPEEAMFESVMLGLRMTEGVSLEAFFQMHGKRLEDVYGARLQKPLREGLAVLENGSLRLTRRGMDMQNRVLVELL